MAAITEARRREIVDALRRGTVPRRGIEHLATGLDRFTKAIDEELGSAAGGKGAFKAVRGDYGCGKTFFARWVAARALEKGFAVAEVQISETETPLHRLETVYRRAVEGLRTQEWEEGAFRALVERWFYDLEEEVVAQGKVQATDEAGLAKAVAELLEARLARIAGMHPAFSSVLRAVYQARLQGDPATADGLLSWLMGEPTVAAESVYQVATDFQSPEELRAIDSKFDANSQTYGDYFGPLFQGVQLSRFGLLPEFPGAEVRAELTDNDLKLLGWTRQSATFPGAFPVVRQR